MTREDVIRTLESLGGTMDFQKATALHLYDILTDESRPHRRALLADEVGLGKTIVARTVVALIREYQRVVKEDKYYRVVYVCSNINIAGQNIDKLGVKVKMDASTSRLSMQHLYIEQNKAQAEEERLRTGRMPEVIIPLTPSTSFDFRSSTGIATERALICVILEKTGVFGMPEANAYLERFFQCAVAKRETWRGYLERYRKEVETLGEGYVDGMRHDLLTRGATELADLARCIETSARPEWREKAALISSIRRVFAEISLEKLEPDLVIMDEFQRFKSLLVGENEQSLLARKFFSDPNTKVLLLSATPYKPYTTLDEIIESRKDEHFSDFRQVMGFLQEGDGRRQAAFDEAWERYNLALTRLQGDAFDLVRVAKRGAEGELYGLMCRTERFNTGGVKTCRERLEVSPEDIRSYFEARRLLDEINAVAARKGFRTMPIDYVKSSPYLMTFMDRYKLKEFVRENQRKLGRRAWDLLYLPYKKIDRYREVPLSNARLQYLYDSLFKDYSAEKLLWVPASRPYYKTHGVYASNAGFSKTLVFSSWEMVPRMVSCMISYSAERLVMTGLVKQNRRPGPYFKAEEKKKSSRYGAGRLSELIKDGSDPLCYVSEYLSGLYQPGDYIGWDIQDIIRKLTGEVEKKISGIVEDYGIPVEERVGMSTFTRLMRFIDSKAEEDMPEAIPADAVENLVLAAIGSPAVCAYRTRKDKEQAERIADFFESMFNRADPATIVSLCCNRASRVYVEEILEYCVEGNLQAVLDEYDHMLEGKWENWSAVLSQGPMEARPLYVEMQDPDKRIVPTSMRVWMAVPFTNAKMEDSAVMHTSVLRNAFNSPFRPFVLSTTSVGQEGLDFHWYARKLLHWNLPSNPVDMEQREGRVNRYKCLSIRQRLGKRYASLPTWDEIFRAARDEYKRDDSDIVPYWCLPKDFPDDGSSLVERIILEYPLSQDQGRYERMKKVLSLYRLTMGQPRQEELLEMLSSSGLSEQQISQLMINLSPYYRDKEE